MRNAWCAELRSGAVSRKTRANFDLRGVTVLLALEATYRHRFEHASGSISQIRFGPGTQ